MKIELDTNNPGDLKLVELIASVIAAEAMPAREPAPEDIAAVATVEQPEPDGAADPEPVEQIGPELDTDGVEWDPKLHASTKTKTRDGRWKSRWKKRRGAKLPDESAAPPVEPVAKPEVEEVTEADYIKALTDHRAKFGIDQTNAVVKATSGAEHVRDVKPEGRAAVVAALQADKGPDTPFDNILEDF